MQFKIEDLSLGLVYVANESINLSIWGHGSSNLYKDESWKNEALPDGSGDAGCETLEEPAADEDGKVNGDGQANGAWDLEVYGDEKAYGEGEYGDGQGSVGGEVYGDGEANGAGEVYGNEKADGEGNIYGDGQADGGGWASDGPLPDASLAKIVSLKPRVYMFTT